MSIDYVLVIRAADARLVRRCESKARAHEAGRLARAWGLHASAWPVADALRFGVVTPSELLAAEVLS